MIPLALDVLGGDLDIAERILGALDAVKHDKDLHVVLVGGQSDIQKFLDIEKFQPFLRHFSILDAPENFSMDRPASEILKAGSSSSLYKAILAVKKQQCVGIVSAGSTGGQMAASLVLLGRIKSISRPGIAIPFPTQIGFSTLIDAGANTDCKPQNLADYAVLGSLYHSALYGSTNPSIGLINNGTEEAKGNTLTKASYSLLKRLHPDTFVGFLEGRDLFKGLHKVIVCDGFTGNIILKTVEGSLYFTKDFLKKQLKSSIKGKIGGFLIRNSFRALVETFDYRAYGGSPLLGVNGISMICHGSSDQLAIKNALLQTIKLYRSNFIQKIS